MKIYMQMDEVYETIKYNGLECSKNRQENRFTVTFSQIFFEIEEIL